jgi:type II secretory pathway pseudopilin PulG
MSSGWLVALEIGVVLGLLGALAVWELVSMRRWRQRERQRQECERDDREHPS